MRPAMPGAPTSSTRSGWASLVLIGGAILDLTTLGESAADVLGEMGSFFGGGVQVRDALPDEAVLAGSGTVAHAARGVARESRHSSAHRNISSARASCDVAAESPVIRVTISRSRPT